jgi:FHA domain
MLASSAIYFVLRPFREYAHTGAMLEVVAAAAGIVKVLSEGLTPLAREFREWRAGSRDDVGVAQDVNGSVHPLETSHGVYRPPEHALADEAIPWGVLEVAFHPGDELAGRHLALDDMALVVLWEVAADPDLESVVVACPLGETWSIELPTGQYHVTALVFDDRRDVLRAAGAQEWLEIPPSGIALSLAVDVLDDDAPTGVLQVADIPAHDGAIILPDGSGVALEGVVTLGRGPTSAIRFEDPAVSRRHAEIHGQADGYWIVDLASANGTYLNGQRIAAHPLHDQDVIQIGPEQLIFVESM